MANREVLIALGSNIGDREQNLVGALGALQRLGVSVTRQSSFYLTEPVGGPEQDWFINAVVRGETALRPEELLRVCLQVEQEFGRERRVKNGPRTLDLDVLFYGDESYVSDALEIPHPRLHERRFVLEPLVEVDPERIHPVLGIGVQELLQACPDHSKVVLHEPRALRP